MRKQHRLDALVWFGLLILAGTELAASYMPMPAQMRPILILPAAVMATLVALGYMRLLSAPQIAKSFAIAGLFWLTVLLGLTMTDPLTRAVYAVVQ